MRSRDAWDMAAEICLSQLPSLVADPNAEFQVAFINNRTFLLLINSKHKHDCWCDKALFLIFFSYD